MGILFNIELYYDNVNILFSQSYNCGLKREEHNIRM